MACLAHPLEQVQYQLGATRRRSPIHIPWTHDRCVACGETQPLTLEHVIPQAIGGRLTVTFLCEPCNSRFGHQVDHSAKQDPAIATAILRLAQDHPKRAPLLENLRLLAHSAGGQLPALIKDGTAEVRSQKLPDGSIIQPTVDARRTIERMLTRAGETPAAVADALERFDSAPVDRSESITPDIHSTNWTVNAMSADPSFSPVSPVLLTKIAYEFLALHLGGAVYADSPPLVAARRILTSQVFEPDKVRIEHLRAGRAHDLHGVVFEGNLPHARVQVRLFGTLAYRVHFVQLSIGGARYVYSHSLDSNAEGISEAL